MKKTGVLFLLMLGTAVVAQQSKTRALKPQEHQHQVTTIVSGKSRSYYSLHDSLASLITLRGPCILRVITRGRFVDPNTDRLDYEVVYVVDGGNRETKKFNSVKRSEKAVYENASHGAPGMLKDFEIELGRGDHSIEFLLQGTSVPVACRYLFSPVKAKKLDWIGYSPLRPSEPVNLLSRESTVCYYRFSKDKPLIVEVIGPTQLRVMTRIENHYQMRGRIHYRIRVNENGKTINTYQLSSRRSEVAAYKEDSALVPGKAREFVIEVPKGRHEYEIYPLDKDKNTVLGRFLLPEKDVRLMN